MLGEAMLNGSVTFLREARSRAITGSNFSTQLRTVS
jgi:hypothetical protein